jgi:hypothetical protein
VHGQLGYDIIPHYFFTDRKQNLHHGFDKSLFARRPRVGKAPPERPLNSARVTALERTLREFPARSSGEVIVPEVGVMFDSIGEAYDFYNLYSWERGFGVRYGKSRLNVDRVKCMQEIVCGCSVSTCPNGFFNWGKLRANSVFFCCRPYFSG